MYICTFLGRNNFAGEHLLYNLSLPLYGYWTNCNKYDVPCNILCKVQSSKLIISSTRVDSYLFIELFQAAIDWCIEKHMILFISNWKCNLPPTCAKLHAGWKHFTFSIAENELVNDPSESIWMEHSRIPTIITYHHFSYKYICVYFYVYF